MTEDVSDYESMDKIIQTEIDQTAPVVYEAAKRAAEADNSIYKASLVHEEDVHVNLGRTQEWIPSIDDDLQFRRPGGGNYIIHESEDSDGSGTYCSIDARVKKSPKELTSLERDRMAFQTLEALSEAYDNVGVLDGKNYVTGLKEGTIESSEETVYYDPKGGDIYLQKGIMPQYDDPQVAGIGLGEMEVDDEWVQIGRVCMYPNGVSEEAVELDRRIRDSQELEEVRDLDERVAPVKDFDSVAEKLENSKSRRIEAEDFLSKESVEKGRKLQEENGYRKADPCF